MSKITTTELVNICFNFCELYSGVKFFPYQAQFAKRIIRSVLDNDGDEITALFSRQSGKSETVATVAGGLAIILPTLANTPMFAGDLRLETFRNGVLIGIFAPVLNQAQTTFNRLKTRLQSISAWEVMQDPDIQVTFDTNNGQNVVLSNGSCITCMSASEGSNIEGKSYMIIIVDEAQDVSNFKYLKSISPMGAFYNATKILVGTPSTQIGFFYHSIERNRNDYKNGTINKRNHLEYDWKVVVKYNAKYEKYINGEKRRLGEDSDEFQMSYCLKWILERGMFINPEHFVRLADSSRGISLHDRLKVHVVGIDCGKQSDSTVVTVLEVDWDNPVLVEESKDLDTPDFIVYEKHIKGWLEIQGDNWEEQYYQVKDYLANYNVARVVIDATGVGSALADRLAANLDCEVIPYVFGTSSKSDLYKHFDREIKASRFYYPADEYTKDAREYRRFEEQMISLLKTYSGQYMVCFHPPERGAHDDYCDSAALACWGAKGEGVDKPVSEKNPITEARRENGAFYSARNSVTARRR